MIHDYATGRLFRIGATLCALYAALALALRPSHLILLLDGLTLSTAAGVSVAYLPVADHALRGRAPSRGDVLGLGIFCGGLSGLAQRAASIVARDLAWPFILNTDVVALAIVLGLLALSCFLWAPYASEGRVPREKWGLAGLIAAAGVATAFAIGTAHHFMLPAPAFRFE